MLVATEYLSLQATLNVAQPLPVTNSACEPVGTKARRAFRELGLFKAARHPPVKAAFYPGIQEATIVAAIAVLLVIAGGPVKRAIGKSLRQQSAEMLALWFQQGIDPPSYYAQDLYKPEHYAMAGHYLTRYETKNGLMATLNTQRPKPHSGHEMNDKTLFSKVCGEAGVAHPRILAECENGQMQWNADRQSIMHDLFCKRRSGMGAKGTHTFRFVDQNRFADDKGTLLSLADVETRLCALKLPMLVQPWLRNHAALSDLAKDSLLTVRVITSLNERDEPEICLAMLRILTVLEPDWRHLPDGEYGTPIDLTTGELGKLTGDSMGTAVERSDNHPVTGKRIAGRFMPDWEATKALACRLHAHVPHRIMVGWDIAVTPQGPVMLEGNTNFDVMFLQRVQDKPASASRLGDLMTYHLDQLEARSQVTG
jgi:hypothetical protein